MAKKLNWKQKTAIAAVCVTFWGTMIFPCWAMIAAFAASVYALSKVDLEGMEEI